MRKGINQIWNEWLNESDDIVSNKYLTNILTTLCDHNRVNYDWKDDKKESISQILKNIADSIRYFGGGFITELAVAIHLFMASNPGGMYSYSMDTTLRNGTGSIKLTKSIIENYFSGRSFYGFNAIDLLWILEGLTIRTGSFDCSSSVSYAWHTAMSLAGSDKIVPLGMGTTTMWNGLGSYGFERVSSVNGSTAEMHSLFNSGNIFPGDVIIKGGAGGYGANGHTAIVSYDGVHITEFGPNYTNTVLGFFNGDRPPYTIWRCMMDDIVPSGGEYTNAFGSSSTMGTVLSSASGGVKGSKINRWCLLNSHNTLGYGGGWCLGWVNSAVRASGISTNKLSQGSAWESCMANFSHCVEVKDPQKIPAGSIVYGPGNSVWGHVGIACKGEATRRKVKIIDLLDLGYPDVSIRTWNQWAGWQGYGGRGFYYLPPQYL